jgi:RNA polymerase sigma-70 factor (ECF subfamily)
LNFEGALTTSISGSISILSKREFEGIFRDHYSSLCAYANHFLRDTDASEEVVQEVMFRLWVNRSSTVITGSMQGYLFRAVRNGCLNVMKHMDVRDAYRQHREREAAGAGLAEEDGLIVSELQQKIRAAIDRLPLERRKVFIMSRYDGMTYGEIAGKLGISVKTVENQMGRALKFLREELAEYLPWLVLFFFDLFRDQP